MGLTTGLLIFGVYQPTLTAPIGRVAVAIAVLHAACTWFMVGLIWVIQRVHYPSMHYIEPDRFAPFEKYHCDAIGSIVAPCMLLEAISSAALAMHCNGPWQWAVLIAGWGLLAILWGSTFWIQVPLHARLQLGKNPDTIDRLVRTNWIRTVAWSIRGALAVWMLVLMLLPSL
jgi:hypothetical protein